MSDPMTPSSDSGWDSLARKAAAVHSGQGEEAAVELVELLTLVLGGDPYAIPVERVREIVRMRAITPMPRVPSSVLGVISLRGEVVEVVDLRLRMNLEAAASSAESRIIIVLTKEGSLAGLLVDRVTDVLRVTEEEMLPPPAGESESIASLCARGDEFVSFIDLDRVLDLGTGR